MLGYDNCTMLGYDNCTMLGYDASDLEIMTTLTNISTLLGNNSNMLNRIVPIVRENLVSASQNSRLVTIIRAITKTLHQIIYILICVF